MTSFAAALGTEPAEIARPASVEEAAAVIARAAAAGDGVIPWGGGAGQDYGYPPRRADVLLDLSGLDRIVAHEPGDLTLTVQAGVTLAAVQKALAPKGQFLPLDPPHGNRATIGGILATNASGPSRVGYGTARDWLLGLTIADARGRLIHGGGKVVKNVTGYDLPKLHVGALGTLGVIVEATFKVAPLPEASVALLLDLSAAADAAVDGLLASLSARRVSPSLSLLHEADGRRHLFLVWRGPREVVDGEVDAVTQTARSAGLPMPHALDPDAFVLSDADEGGDDAVHLRLSTLPAQSWQVHRAAAETGAVRSLRTGPFTGTVDIVCGDQEAAALLLAWTARSGDSVRATVLHAPLSLRRRDGIALWHPLPPAFPLMQRMKETLDPAGTLNPGRYVGRI